MIKKTFDLSTLNLSAGTYYEITVKARASSYSDSEPSNAVNYVVASEETYTVSGTWVFDETIYSYEFTEGENVSFVSNGKQYNRMHGYFPQWNYDDDTVYTDTFVGGQGWEDQAYRTITFDGVQTVSKEFYEWLVANAVQTYTVSGTWIFNETPDVSKEMSVECEFWVTDVLGLHQYKKIEIKNNALYYCTDDNSVQVYSVGEGWLLNAQKEIVFVETQTVSKEFYEWFTANAVRQTITLNIDFYSGKGATYEYTKTVTAYSGMTWEEWVNSDYNTIGAHVSGDEVLYGEYKLKYGSSYGDTNVNPSDIIDENTYYAFVSHSK